VRVILQPMLDLTRFYKACNPSKTLDTSKPEDRQYYIDFAVARGGTIIREIERTIARISPDEPTCQLFAGHIGCGKSTELLRLKSSLARQGFHVVYFESSKDLDPADVDVSDILLAIARQVSKSLEDIQIELKPKGFKNLLQGAAKVLNARITGMEAKVPLLDDIGFESQETGEFSIALGIGKITAKARDSRDVRSLLRQYLEPRANSIIEGINEDLLQPAIAQLRQRGRQGLVVIVDNLDRIDNSPKPSGGTQPEYLFVERGEQLNQLQCHVVYTIPLVLRFSNDLERLRNRFGSDPKVLPMVRVRQQDGQTWDDGMVLLKQMVLARAFPDLEPSQRLDRVLEVFDATETLDRLCAISGGHVRNLLVILYRCLQKDDPPISRDCLESVITERCNELRLAIAPPEWDLLKRVKRERMVRGESEYQALLRSLFVFEYRDSQEYWFEINPVLADAKELQP